MSKRVLITGGAGFIGSHLADELLRTGHKVRVLDNLCPQVHGPDAQRPAYLDKEVELLVGDVRDSTAVGCALRGVDAVFHFVAAVGVGQSMYEIESYTSTNNVGTAVLLEALMAAPVPRLIVASSMSLYGEGLYVDAEGQVTPFVEREIAQLKARKWEPADAIGRPLVPIPTPETKPPSLASVYALSKYDQERLCLITGRAYGIPTVALRFFNVYGPRQALSNPYTGVLAIFASRLLNNASPLIFEDGRQTRDFVNVRDIARACLLALDSPTAAGQVINIGGGQARSVLEIAERLARVLGKTHIEPTIAGKYRAGDIRHCFADISLARDLLGYEPKVGLDEGMEELADWLDGQVAEDHVNEAREQLDSRGLAI